MWQVWIDTGGTFTDAVAIAPDGTRHRRKVLSTGALRVRAVARRGPRRIELAPGLDAPEAVVRSLRLGRTVPGSPAVAVRGYDARACTIEVDARLELPELPASLELVSDEEAPVLAARLLTGVAAPAPLPPLHLRLATTLGTNALLERRGAPVALFVTRGFADLLEIGTQERPDLFALDVDKPPPLYDAVVEVPGRIDAAGSVLEPLDVPAVLSRATQVRAGGISVAAVALMHAWVNPAHERELARALRSAGFAHVCCSAALAPRIKILPRATTAVVEAYLAPVLSRYLAGVSGAVARGSLLVLTSAGGLREAAKFRATDGLLSGPAAGVVGAAEEGRASGFARVLGFDMGGTSTDVWRHDGSPDYVFEHRVGPATIAAPALAIETVAAGGGSCCWLDGARLRVGPRSAGAAPGPACYGAGGPLTLTDVDLLLGRIDPARFEIPIDADPAAARADELRAELERRTGERPSRAALLAGLLDVAAETMAGAMRRVSVRRGYDPAEHVLVAFGGAGPQHACAVAARLGVPRIVVPADAALLSAVGLGRAAIEHIAERQILAPLERVEPDLCRLFAELAGGAPVRRRILCLRFSGQEAGLDIDWAPRTDARAAFARRHEALFGHRPEGRPIEVESLRLVTGEPGRVTPPAGPRPRARAAAARGTRRAWFEGRWLDAATFERCDLRPGSRLAGPALIAERSTTTVVAPGWAARIDARGAIVLDRRPGAGRSSRTPEAARLELFTQRFAGIAGEMGERLRRTAVSTNVKERLDYSCALLDRRGRLVASAPHVPVHLGALGLCVRRVRRAVRLRPGDVVVTNHPAHGGSHLPDVTVITPVFRGRGTRARLVGHVASRAHHAEIGGSRPGSMPPAATCLAEEGVVVPPTHLVRGGRPRWRDVERLLLGGPWPTRRLSDNLADLRAALAANRAGELGLLALVGEHGPVRVARYMRGLAGLAAERARRALASIGDGEYRATERLDDGTPLAVRISITSGTARLDFSGTGGLHPGNLNAPPAVVRSVVMYVLRLLVREDLPLNEGLLDPVTLTVPPGLLDPPFAPDPSRCPAVVGGNVETSQRLVDLLLRALDVAACSQGTMNNVIFGNAGFAYYETLGGGCGAREGHAGASAVHSHMTNTRVTDPEILEQRYPVRLERFAVRRGSGGAGCHPGGDGLLRRIRFLQPASVSVLTQHRRVAPYGLHGGAPGACGAQRVERASGEVVPLGPCDGVEVGPGDVLTVETPGGGGWGARGDP